MRSTCASRAAKILACLALAGCVPSAPHLRPSPVPPASPGGYLGVAAGAARTADATYDPVSSAWLEYLRWSPGGDAAALRPWFALSAGLGQTDGLTVGVGGRVGATLANRLDLGLSVDVGAQLQLGALASLRVDDAVALYAVPAAQRTQDGWAWLLPVGLRVQGSENVSAFIEGGWHVVPGSRWEYGVGALRHNNFAYLTAGVLTMVIGRRAGSARPAEATAVGVPAEPRRRWRRPARIGLETLGGLVGIAATVGLASALGVALDDDGRVSNGYPIVGGLVGTLLVGPTATWVAGEWAGGDGSWTGTLLGSLGGLAVGTALGSVGEGRGNEVPLVVLSIAASLGGGVAGYEASR